MRALRLAVVLLVATYVAQPSRAQDDARRADPRAQVDRFLAYLERNPFHDRTFDLLVETAVDGQLLPEVVEELEAAHAAEPEAATPRILLGRLAARQGRLTEAIGHLEGVEPRAPGVDGLLANLYLETGRPNESAEAAERALEATTDLLAREALHETLGLALLGQGERELAAEALRAPARDDTASFPVRMDVASRLALHGLIDAAAEEYGTAAELAGDDPARRTRALVALAELYEEFGRWEDALDGYARVLPVLGRGHWQRADLEARILRLHERRGTLDDWIVELRAEVEAEPDDLERSEALSDALAARGDHADALAALDGAVAARPSDAALADRRLAILRELADDGGLLDELSRVLEHHGSNPEYWIELGAVHARAERDDAARHAWTRATDQRPGDPNLRRRVARLCAREGFADEAVAHHRAAIERAPRELANWEELAHDLRALGRGDEVAGVLEEARAALAGDGGLLAELGRSARELGEGDLAVAILTDAESALPGDLAILRERARAERELGDLDAAARALREVAAATGDPYERDRVLGELLDLHDSAGRLVVALGAEAGRVEADPRAPVPRLLLALHHEREREFDEVVRHLEAIADVEGYEEEVRRRLVEAHRSMGEPAAALRQLELLTERFPSGRARWLEEMAEVCEERGDFDAARAVWGQVLLETPRDADALRAAALFFEERGDPERARESLLRVLRLRPELAAARVDLARVAFQLGREVEGGEQLNLVLRTRGDEDASARRDAHGLLHAVWSREDRLAAELVRLEAAFQETPWDLDAARLLAALYENGRQTAQAELVLARALEHHANEPELLRWRADLLYRLERREEALAVYDRLWELSEADREATGERIAGIAAELGDVRRAREVVDPETDALRLAVIFDAQGLSERAIRLFLDHLEESPSDDDARARLARMLEREGRLREARDQYRILAEHSGGDWRDTQVLASLSHRLGDDDEARAMAVAALDAVVARPGDLDALARSQSAGGRTERLARTAARRYREDLGRARDLFERIEQSSEWSRALLDRVRRSPRDVVLFQYAFDTLVASPATRTEAVELAHELARAWWDSGFDPALLPPGYGVEAWTAYLGGRLRQAYARDKRTGLDRITTLEEQSSLSDFELLELITLIEDIWGGRGLAEALDGVERSGETGAHVALALAGRASAARSWDVCAAHLESALASVADGATPPEPLAWPHGRPMEETWRSLQAGTTTTTTSSGGISARVGGGAPPIVEKVEEPEFGLGALLDPARIQLQRARALEEGGDVDASNALVADLLPRDADDAEAWVALSQRAAAAGFDRVARDAARRALAADTLGALDMSAAERGALARESIQALADEERWVEAFELCRAEGLRFDMVVRRASGRRALDEALGVLVAEAPDAETRGPLWRRASILLAERALERGLVSSFGATVEELAALDDAPFRVLLWSARVRADAGDVDGALAAYARALAAPPSSDAADLRAGLEALEESRPIGGVAPWEVFGDALEIEGAAVRRGTVWAERIELASLHGRADVVEEAIRGIEASPHVALDADSAGVLATLLLAAPLGPDGGRVFEALHAAAPSSELVEMVGVRESILALRLDEAEESLRRLLHRRGAQASSRAEASRELRRVTALRRVLSDPEEAREAADVGSWSERVEAAYRAGDFEGGLRVLEELDDAEIANDEELVAVDLRLAGLRGLGADAELDALLAAEVRKFGAREHREAYAIELAERMLARGLPSEAVEELWESARRRARTHRDRYVLDLIHWLERRGDVDASVELLDRLAFFWRTSDETRAALRAERARLELGRGDLASAVAPFVEAWGESIDPAARLRHLDELGRVLARRVDPRAGDPEALEAGLPRALFVAAAALGCGDARGLDGAFGVLEELDPASRFVAALWRAADALDGGDPAAAEPHLETLRGFALWPSDVDAADASVVEPWLRTPLGRLRLDDWIRAQDPDADPDETTGAPMDWALVEAALRRGDVESIGDVVGRLVDPTRTGPGLEARIAAADLASQVALERDGRSTAGYFAAIEVAGGGRDPASQALLMRRLLWAHSDEIREVFAHSSGSIPNEEFQLALSAAAACAVGDEPNAVSMLAMWSMMHPNAELPAAVALELGETPGFSATSATITSSGSITLSRPTGSTTIQLPNYALGQARPMRFREVETRVLIDRGESLARASVLDAWMFDRASVADLGEFGVYLAERGRADLARPLLRAASAKADDASRYTRALAVVASVGGDLEELDALVASMFEQPSWFAEIAAIEALLDGAGVDVDAFLRARLADREPSGAAERATREALVGRLAERAGDAVGAAAAYGDARRALAPLGGSVSRSLLAIRDAEVRCLLAAGRVEQVDAVLRDPDLRAHQVRWGERESAVTPAREAARVLLAHGDRARAVEPLEQLALREHRPEDFEAWCLAQWHAGERELVRRIVDDAIRARPCARPVRATADLDLERRARAAIGVLAALAVAEGREDELEARALEALDEPALEPLLRLGWCRALIEIGRPERAIRGMRDMPAPWDRTPDALEIERDAYVRTRSWTRAVSRSEELERILRGRVFAAEASGPARAFECARAVLGDPSGRGRVREGAGTLYWPSATISDVALDRVALLLRDGEADAAWELLDRERVLARLTGRAVELDAFEACVRRGAWLGALTVAPRAFVQDEARAWTALFAAL